MKSRSPVWPDALRVLVVGVSWPPETFLDRLLAGLLDRGLRITVVSKTRPEAAWLSRRGFDWVRSDGGFRPVQVARSARLRAAAARCDLVYFPWNEGAIANRPLFELGVPVVVSCRGAQVNVAPHDPARAGIRKGLAETFRKAAAVHCVSEAIRREAALYGLDEGRAQVIHPAVDPNFFHPAEPPREREKALQIVSTGSLIWRKGYEYALVALRKLLDRGVAAELVLVGEGPERARVLYTVGDLGLEGRVHLRGRLSPEHVREELWRADVFLLASLSEGISNAVLEGMACGLPVVTTRCGGMEEAVTDGVEGRLVALRDAQAMAGALETLAARPEDRRRMGRSARERILRQFTLDRQIDQFVAMFHGAVHPAGSAPIAAAGGL